MIKGAKVLKVVDIVAAMLAVDCSSERGEVILNGLSFLLGGAAAARYLLFVTDVIL